MNRDERKLLQLTLRIARAVMRAKLNAFMYKHDVGLQHYFAVFNLDHLARLRREYKKQADLMSHYTSGRASVIIYCQARLLDDGEEHNSTWLIA